MDQQTNGGIHPTLKDHYAGMNNALHERDKYSGECQRLQNALTVAEGKINFLQKQLDKVSEERDYYYRKSFAYTNTLVNMRNTMQNMLDLADHEAEKGNLQKLPKATNIEQARQLTEAQLIGELNDH